MNELVTTLTWQGPIEVNLEAFSCAQVSALPDSPGLYAIFGYHVAYSPLSPTDSVADDLGDESDTTRFEEAVLLYIGKSEYQSIRKRILQHCQPNGLMNQRDRCWVYFSEFAERPEMLHRLHIIEAALIQGLAPALNSGFGEQWNQKPT